ncbi:tubulin epsilon and delta complex protein 1 isoform X5 [Syngnathoides biaculeatus]|uniref:tubulin epsilon and delta complex protein 1 isoform X5 n=1 Tax=Syngnathoides biaculeatus TaxID=300417 RepID=UPI002ADDE3EE|nr:tubulin epsilon and delta complex protein 1 isoform X5 [Syngnathoides biaculeatus]
MSQGLLCCHKASVEVKEAIGTLCKLLMATGLQHVPTPETFRLAKFDNVNVEDRLWQLLVNILQTTTVSSVGCTRMINVTGERRTLVSTGLWQSGYHARWMYRKEVGGVSSRDLLLALGWLLASGTLEKLLTQRVQMDKTLLPRIHMKVEIPQDTLVENSSVRRLLWLIGCLKHQGRILLSMQDEQASLLHTTCTGVQELCDLLGLYLNWKQVENVFWIWMKGQKTGRGDATNRKCRLQDTLETSSEQPYFDSLPPLLSVSQPYRARFQVKTLNSCSFKNLPGMVKETNEVPVSHILELLTHTERRLQEGRDTQRLANRMQLQEMIGRLNKLVLIMLQT